MTRAPAHAAGGPSSNAHAAGGALPVPLTNHGHNQNQPLDQLMTLLSMSSSSSSSGAGGGGHVASPHNLSRASSVGHLHSPSGGTSPMIMVTGTHRKGTTNNNTITDLQGPASVSTVAETAQWLLALDEEADYATASVDVIAAAAAPAHLTFPRHASAAWIASPLSATPAGSTQLIGGGGEAPSTTVTTTRTSTTASVSLSDMGYHTDDEYPGGNLSDDDNDDDDDDAVHDNKDADRLSWLHETFASSLSTLLSASRVPTPYRRTPSRSNSPIPATRSPRSPLHVPELLLHIFHYLTLDPPSLLSAACTCRTWSRLAVPLLYDHLELWSPYDVVHLAQTLVSLRATCAVPGTLGPRSLSFRRCENLTAPLLLSLYPSTHHPPRTLLRALDLYVCPDLSPDLLPTLFPLNPRSPSTLSILRLAGCPRISDSDLLHVAHNCPLLTDLDLRACYQVTDAGVCAIARACPRLVAINVGRAVDGALITDAALGALARGCPRLAHVGLAGTHVTDAGVRVLVASGARRRTGTGVRILCMNMCPLVTPALVIWLGRRVGVAGGAHGAAARAVRIAALDTVEFRDCPHFASATRDIDQATARGRALWRGWCRMRRAGIAVALPVTLLSAMHWYAVRLVDVQYARDQERAASAHDGAAPKRRMGSGRAVGPLWPLLGELLGESVLESTSVGASNAPSHVWETGSVVGMQGGGHGLVGGGGWSSNPALGI